MLRSKADGGMFLNDETYENNDIFFHTILEYDRPNLEIASYPEAQISGLSAKI